MAMKTAGGVKRGRYHAWMRRRWEERARAAADRRQAKKQEGSR